MKPFRSIDYQQCQLCIIESCWLTDEEQTKALSFALSFLIVSRSPIAISITGKHD